MIGSFLLWTWVWLWGSICALLGMISFVIFNPLVDPKRTMVTRFSTLWGKGVMWVLPGITIELVNPERLEHGAVMLTPNHTSVADIIMLLAAMPPFKFLTKAPLFYVPPLAFQLRAAGYIMASSGEDADGSAGRRIKADALKWLGRGCHLLWFPEGTRSEDGKVLRFKKPAFLIAKEAGVPIVPVAISGTREVIKKKSLRYNFKSRVVIELLEPFMVDDPKEAAIRARTAVATALGQTVPARPEAPSGPAEPSKVA